MASNCSVYSLLETMSCITLQCGLSIYLQMHNHLSSLMLQHDEKGKMAGLLRTHQSQTAVLTWEVFCLAACKSSACLGGKARHICNRICGSFSPPWKETNRAVRSVTKGSAVRPTLSSTYIACLMTLDFSSRYSDILAPMTAPVGVNFISRYLPKRLELSFMAVQAFPKASTRGFTCKIFSRSVRLFA